MQALTIILLPRYLVLQRSDNLLLTQGKHNVPITYLKDINDAGPSEFVMEISNWPFFALPSPKSRRNIEYHHKKFQKLMLIEEPDS